MNNKRTMFFISFCIVVMSVFAYSYISAYNTTISERFIEDDNSAASAIKADVVTESTNIVMEIYDKYTNKLYETEYEQNQMLYGKNRSEVDDYLSGLNDKISNAEKDSGFIGYQLVYFSGENVTIRKNYDTSVNACTYLLKDDNGYIVVYNYPENTVYHNTGILSVSLEQDVRDELKSGIFIMDINELYDFLEGCSS